MKHLYILLGVILLMCTAPCYAQKMIQMPGDAKKLEINKETFKGKPLRVLLEQIEPKIKFVYGNPENTWAGAVGGTYLKFHFVDWKAYADELKRNQKPTGIVVTFKLEPGNKQKPLPKEGLKEWTEENTKDYGDMIILDIRVINVN